MKLLISALLLVCGLQVQASGIDDVINLIGGNGNQYQNQPDYGSGQQDWRRPGRPGRPGYPGNPGYANCVAVDAGYEEHRGGHFDCRECLREHDQCIETCNYRDGRQTRAYCRY